MLRVLIGMLMIVLAAPTLRADDPSKAAAELKKLQDELKEARAEYAKALREAKTPEERQEAAKKNPSLTFLPRFFEFAEKNGKDRRGILSPERSLGSVIKLLTPSRADYNAEYNAWLDSIPQHVKELVFVVKRFYDQSWGENWRSRFSVDIRDGKSGNELKLDGRTLVSNFLRVGFGGGADGAWRVFGLRKDFHPSFKIQTEDDITASVVVPAGQLKYLNPMDPHPSVKFAVNTEARLFQRPDDAIHRGYDKQAERDGW